MKISNAKGRNDNNSGYSRVFGNQALGKLVSKVQATVISNGSELERMIVARSQTIDNLDEFINDVTDAQKKVVILGDSYSTFK